MKMAKLAWLTFKNGIFVRVFWLLAGAYTLYGLFTWSMNTDKKWTYRLIKTMEY